MRYPPGNATSGREMKFLKGNLYAARLTGEERRYNRGVCVDAFFRVSSKSSYAKDVPRCYDRTKRTREVHWTRYVSGHSTSRSPVQSLGPGLRTRFSTLVIIENNLIVDNQERPFHRDHRRFFDETASHRAETHIVVVHRFSIWILAIAFSRAGSKVQRSTRKTLLWRQRDSRTGKRKINKQEEYRGLAGTTRKEQPCRSSRRSEFSRGTKVSAKLLGD